VTVRLAEEKDWMRIDDYVRNSRLANSNHDYRWGRVIEKCFGHEYEVFLSENSDGAVVGILPFVHMKSWSFGNFIVSMPFLNYGGVCADDDGTQRLLIAEAVRFATERKVQHIEFRQEESFNNGFPEKTHKVSMRLDLPDSTDDLLKSFPSKLRSQIRVPQKAGMTCRIGRLDELESFYSVFSINMRHLGTPVYPKSFFGGILEEFPETTWICSVYAGETPVASGFLSGFKHRMEIPWASSVRNYNRQSPNMLLYWSCLKFSCEKGYKAFDFGRSTAGESTYKFKEQWGAKPSPMIWSYWVGKNGSVPDLTPNNPKYQLAIGLWRRLPLGVTKILGPRIVRNIP
jgi:FemAB-related protein (PEP-CTERM system-associated)